MMNLTKVVQLQTMNFTILCARSVCIHIYKEHLQSNAIQCDHAHNQCPCASQQDPEETARWFLSQMYVRQLHVSGRSGMAKEIVTHSDVILGGFA